MDTTITAIATAIGGGISIIRISGKKAFDIIKKISDITSIEHGKIKYSHIKYKDDIIDEVMISTFVAPKSYTTEDVVEINCHGGAVVTHKILDIILNEGAVLAEPGEFTKRAFLNGRIDLSQAESIVDIILAKTEKEQKNAFEQLEGKLSIKIKEIRKNLIDIVSDIQAKVDYPEYDVPEISINRTLDKLKLEKNKINKISESFFEGKILKEGISIAIVGKPNVGKSSLLNLIIKKDRAIITDIPGTTRDTLEEYINIKGISAKIIDTAGVRDTNDVVEKIGIDKSKKAIDRADMVIVVLDGSRELDEDDFEVIKYSENKNRLIVFNKCDLIRKANIENVVNFNDKVINISAKNEEGIDDIENYIIECFKNNKITQEGEVLVTNLRHQKILNKVNDFIIEAIKDIENGVAIDIVSINIISAVEGLGEITGETASEDIISDIFSKFCLGK